jgi:D-beta-D-heptose 7-phosphate kinase/D-beta-D-heptose 1-phosphate adenosyltransferase
MSSASPPPPDFAGARVLVVGDVMLDRYWYGATGRISPEAPVPVVHVQDVEDRPGGAANVALNIASLGASAVLVGVSGDDEAADTLEALLAARGVVCRLVRVPGQRTVTKLRVVSRHQQLIRLDFEDAVDAALLDPSSEGLRRAVEDADVVVLSDYGKGTLSGVQGFIGAARAAGRPVLVDPKGVDFSRYRDASVLTPNLSELEAVVGPCRDLDALVERGEALRDSLGLEALLVTRSEHGMTLVASGRPARHLAANAREVFDVTGAGDTVVGVLAAALAAGASVDDAMVLANVAAGVVVGKLGTASVSAAELAAAMAPRGFGSPGILGEGDLLRRVAEARGRGERVVMTNGVFDILHAGHVRYLLQARALGDRLVVAVNDDASVKRLKGHDRPINPLDRRMAVLDALACVDWVVPFAEDTPERLVCAVRPDVLVKGGDYRPEQIAGGECVREGGGEVVVLGYEPGCSTTALIETIHRRAALSDLDAEGG